MFSPEAREQVRTELLEIAKQDKRILGGAVTGSATIGKLDTWSDIDLAFVPHTSFGARAATFKLIFGQANTIAYDPPAKSEDLIGWCWLNALHVRSSLNHKHFWQAEYYASSFKNNVITLCCRRFGLPEKQGRGVDQLPEIERKQFEVCLIRSIEALEIQRAFKEIIRLCLQEIQKIDISLYNSLETFFKNLLTNYDE